MIINIYKHRAAVIAIFIIASFSSFLIYLWLHDSSKNQQRGEKSAVLYGDYLSWDEVDHLFPKYCEASVIDVDSGLHFRVQRRGGTYHADVQPLTAEDTEVMKNIYHDKWSWKRKAVIIELDSGQSIAASMNGMPHGLGNIQGNDFDGHFCIHFKDSRTHCSRKVDTAHQLMIWKAAGILSKQLSSLNAPNTVDVFFSAIDQGELLIAGMLLDFSGNNTLLLAAISMIDDIKPFTINKIDENTYQVDLSLIYKNSDTQYHLNMPVKTIQRNSQWKIDPQSLIPLLEETNAVEYQESENALFEEDLEEGSL